MLPVVLNEIPFESLFSHFSLALRQLELANQQANETSKLVPKEKDPEVKAKLIEDGIES
jgi:hypothetical protein